MKILKIEKNHKTLIQILTLSLIILFGIYLCSTNNYGWDWDTYEMINTFYNILENSVYERSRGAGYLVPEIGIGFLSYFFGSIIVNLFTFILLILGLIFFYFSFENSKKNLNEIFYFLILKR